MRILITALFLFLVACSSPLEQPLPKHVATEPVPHTARMDRYELLNDRVKERVEKGLPVDLVFLGDSITEQWESRGAAVWEERYQHRNAVNLGIGGDRTQHVLWRMDNGNLDGLSPKLVVLMIGTNNSGSESSEEIADGVRAIVKDLREDLPKTRILLLGIFPRGEDASHRLRLVNEDANALISKLHDGEWVHYLDIGEAFTKPGGELTTDVMYDHLHLTDAGYRIWADSIKEYVFRYVDLAGLGFIGEV